MHLTDTIHLELNAARAEARLFVDPQANYLRDHFPGAPVLPGLVMLQVAVRAASTILAGDAASAQSAELESVERLQVMRRVSPGETLQVAAVMVERTPDGGSALFTADGRVGGQAAMRARFRLRTLKGWSRA